jgi:hypothetical protein
LIFLRQDALGRAADAIRESYSADTVVLARRVAIRSDDDLLQLLNEAKPPQARERLHTTAMSALPVYASAPG